VRLCVFARILGIRSPVVFLFLPLLTATFVHNSFLPDRTRPISQSYLNPMATPPASLGSSSGALDSDQAGALIQIVLAIPHATIHQRTSSASEKKTIGTGELRVYSTAPPGTSPSNPQTVTFMTLETNDTPTKSFKSLITHPLMPRSTAQKTGDRTWQFSVAGNGFLELVLPE